MREWSLCRNGGCGLTRWSSCNTWWWWWWCLRKSRQRKRIPLSLLCTRDRRDMGKGRIVWGRLRWGRIISQRTSTIRRRIFVTRDIVHVNNMIFRRGWLISVGLEIGTWGDDDGTRLGLFYFYICQPTGSIHTNATDHSEGDSEGCKEDDGDTATTNNNCHSWRGKGSVNKGGRREEVWLAWRVRLGERGSKIKCAISEYGECGGRRQVVFK